MLLIYMMEDLAVRLLYQEMWIKSQYFMFKLHGIVFFIQVIQAMCELLFSISPHEKYIINVLWVD